MPEYLHPGVYIEETSYRGKPIQGVSTSTAGFVGAARKGPTGRAEFVGSFSQFRRIFGDQITTPSGLGDYLGHSVKAFFDNGGARCYVVRCLADDAQQATTTMHQGIALRLAAGVAVRGPTRTLRLNALRGVEVGSQLRIYTRSEPDGDFSEDRSVTVESYDAGRNSVEVIAADEIPTGTEFDPNHTAILIDGIDPAALPPAPGAGPTFTARYPGVDGNAISVEIRPRDRAPVGIRTSEAVRADPPLDLAGPDLAVGDTTLQMTSPALRMLRVGDLITVGPDEELAVTGIAPGDVTFDVTGGAADHSAGGGTISLIERGGTALATPVVLGASEAAFDIDLTGGGPFGPSGLSHNMVMMLRAGDVLEIDTAGTVSTLSVTAVQTAQDIAPGAHVTVGAALTAASALPVEARISQATDADADFARLFLADASSFTAPQDPSGPTPVSISNGTATERETVLLADAATNTLFVSRATFPSTVTLDDWRTVEGLAAAVDGQTVFPVENTSAFYSGAKVEFDTGTEKHEGIVQAVNASARTVTLAAGLPLGAGNVVEAAADRAERNVFLRTCEMDVVVYENGVVSETFEGLTWNPDETTDAGLRYFVSRINDEEIGSDLVLAAPAAGPGLGFAEAPTTANGHRADLTSGSNGSALEATDIIGTDNGPGDRTGIQALMERSDISMVATPGVFAETVQGALITHCERMRYRMAVLDSPPDATTVPDLQSHRFNYDSKYAAYYAPWMKALNPMNGRIESFPPSTYAMGIYARSDNLVGVHKAPANEVVRNVTDVSVRLGDPEQDVLNPVGVNLIRDLTPRGIRVWGARTISSDQEWKYVNIRRLFIYIEHSIDLGTQWVVFEPNSEALWAKVTETVTSFLTGVWKSGALMGTTPEQAFFVTCDRTTMTQDDIDNGRLICEIGLAPVAPAEFVIFRIGQATLTE